VGPVACSAKGLCGAMELALKGTHQPDRTGLVQSIFPPNRVGIRYKGKKRGEYRVLIFNMCPWCGAKMAFCQPREGQEAGVPIPTRKRAAAK